MFSFIHDYNSRRMFNSKRCFPRARKKEKMRLRSKRKTRSRARVTRTPHQRKIQCWQALLKKIIPTRERKIPPALHWTQVSSFLETFLNLFRLGLSQGSQIFSFWRAPAEWLSQWTKKIFARAKKMARLDECPVILGEEKSAPRGERTMRNFRSTKRGRAFCEF